MTPTTYTLTLTVETDADPCDLLDWLHAAIPDLSSTLESYGYTLHRPDEVEDSATVTTHEEPSR
jgi:hypothetical protein